MDLDALNWDDIRVFLAIHREGSVRAAGKSLGVNASTVSRRLSALEAALGARLFDRLPDGYAITDSGRSVAKSAQQMESGLNDLALSIAGTDSELRGALAITLPDMLAVELLADEIAEFQRTYPEIELEIDVSYTVANLNRREADVAIRVTNAPPESAIGRKVGQYKVATYARRDLLDDALRPLPGAHNVWLGWNDSEAFPEWVQQSAYPEFPCRGRINNALLQLSACKAGMGMAMIPCFLGDSAPELSRVAPGELRDGYEIWVLSHQDLRQTARVRVFRDFIADAFRRLAPRLNGEI